MSFSRRSVPFLEAVLALVSIGCGWFTFRGKYWPYVFIMIALRAFFAALAKSRRPSTNTIHVYKVVKPLSTTLTAACLIFATFLTLPDVRLPSFQEQVFIMNLSFSLALVAYFRGKKDMVKYAAIPAGAIVAGTCLVALASGKTSSDSRRAAVGILLGVLLWLSSFVIKKLLGRSTGRMVKRVLLVAACLCFAAPLFDD